MKIAAIIIIVFHGLIHLMGFSKAFNLEAIVIEDISKLNGIFWLVAAILFVVTAILLLKNIGLWWIAAAAATLLSQYLIMQSWTDAKIGTIANVIIFIATIIGYAAWAYKHKYRNEVATYLKDAACAADLLLTETDVMNLPECVKKYLYYTGSVGKPKVKNFKVEFAGQIRKSEKSEWMPFTSEQYNFVDASARLFFMKATMKHLPVVGFHAFKNGNAFMDIRLFSLFKVQYQAGKEMDVAETVTFFNDMCCMAPATLIDNRIKWLEVEGNKVKAQFTSNGITISACLQFNNKGELINFVSDDRYATTENNVMKRLRWLTPMKEYKTFDGHKLAGYAEAIYAYPDGDLCYGNFRLTNIVYNCRQLL